ncbi:MAG: hypothetical protein JNJ54_07275 [Myxococcaceae bacterium]|nr:hypothetical protein [Myxococcaceae bacterium]
MLSCALALALTAAPTRPPPRTPSANESALLLTAAAIERIEVKISRLDVEVDTWRAEVRLRASEGAEALRKLVPKTQLCPRRVVRDGALVLSCRTARFEVHPRQAGDVVALELVELRGLPHDEPRATGVAWHYPPDRHAYGRSCPGSHPVGVAECLMQAGKLAEAEQALRGVIEQNTDAFAMLRLGDLVLRRDPLEALAHYQAAGRRDFFGRVARVRVCELAGCGDEDVQRIYDPTGMPEPMRTELELRFARALSLSGDLKGGAQVLLARLGELRRDPVCPAWPEVCAGVSARALESPDVEVQALGLEVFLGYQRESGPVKDVALVRRVAEVSATFGAHAFAANLLASVTDRVTPPRLKEHLERLVEYYTRAGDPVRAAVVRDFAATRLKAPLVEKRLPKAKPEPRDDVLDRAQVAMKEATQQLDLAAALSTVSRARAAGVPEP